ncbi:MAG: hypothetical protein JWN36_218 [Microbacteriaceae bacterium]|nr:hypothetical protein [Microbacteriaceae bacterium]
MRGNSGAVDPAAEEPAFDAATLADLVAEGMLIVGSAIRLSVSNQAIVRALRDHADFDREWYSAAVVQQLALLADEKHADAERVAEELASATGRAGKARHQSDYRQRDVLHLRQRKAVLDSLVHEIRAREGDDDYVDALAAASRLAASDEIRGAIRESALRTSPRAQLLPPEERRKRILALKAELAREVGGRHR